VELITSEERDRLFATFEREALHLEMRDVYTVQDEAERFARFLETGHRDQQAEEGERRPWMTLVKNATQAGKVIRRARIISEPVTDYIQYEWAGTDANIHVGEDIRWLPRRLASGLALPGNDYWLFDGATAVFTVFTGAGDVAERQLTTDADIVQLCKSAFQAVWSIAVPHSEYAPL
jgi:hypothetical protein